MKFAHIADSHLGAFTKNKNLKRLNLEAFKKAIEMSIAENVDFIIIAGDLFHNPLPDMETVRTAVYILNKARARGIRIYVVYGSHDFSAGTTSLLDVLSEAGVFKKVVRYEQLPNGKIKLLPIKDESGVYLVGMPGLTAAREVFYFVDEEQGIDREYLNTVPNPKIFIFHTTVEELKPEYIADKNAVPLSRFPHGFDYYAGGHLHERIEHKMDSGYLIYPGALFGSNYNDLDVLTGKQRGFYIVEDFEPRFVPVKVCEFEKKVVNADGKSAMKLESELMDYASKNHEGKVIILKVRGELTEGKIADINFRAIRNKLQETAIDALLNTYALTTVERARIRVPAMAQEEIEHRVFEEISKYGVDFTNSLFHVLREEKKDEETKHDFEERITHAAMDMILHVLEQSATREQKKSKTESGKDEKPQTVSKESKEELRNSKNRQNTSRKEQKKPVSLFDFG